MVTSEQWSASKKFAWGFTILLFAFLCVEIVSYWQFRAQKSRLEKALDQMQQHVSDEAAAVRNNDIEVKIVERKLDEFTGAMKKMDKNIKDCSRCHSHEAVFKSPRKK